jgi:hypothetical protein
MKKLAAILLLAIFAFNMFGYKLWSYYAEQHADQSLAIAVDRNDYNEAELVLVTKTINLPYYNNTKDFTLAGGEAEINGVFYTYVKYRINNNQLEMLCLPNTQKTKIRQAKNDFYNTTADIEKKATEKNKSNSGLTVKKAVSEYDENSIWKPGAVINQKSIVYSSLYNTNLGALHKATVEQPPEYLPSV